MPPYLHIGLLCAGRRAVVSEDGSLPSFSVDSMPWYWQDVGDAAERFSDLLGAPVTVLRPLAMGEAAGRRVRVYALEAHGPVALDSQDIGSLPDPLPGRSVTSLTALGPDGPLAVPWYRPGWYQTALAWIRESVPAARHDNTAIRQRRSWGISTLIDITTESGPLFFKAASPPFAGEIARTASLADRFPDVLPEIVAIDLDRGWVVFADAGALDLELSQDLNQWERAIRSYARLQMDSVELLPDLVASGMPLYPNRLVADQIHDMVSDVAALTAGQEGLSPPEIEAVQSAAGRWIAAVRALDALDIPLAIEHGDLHPGQFILDDAGRVRILDWSDVAYANPLISLDTFLRAVQRNLEADAEVIDTIAQRCRAAYLDEWSAVVEMDRLEEAARLLAIASDPLQALPYWRLVPRMEQSWEFEDVLPSMLRPRSAGT
jgi:hypothetical protein